MNIVILQGRLASAPDTRVLADGAAVHSFDLAAEMDGRKSVVPVSWRTERAPQWPTGAELVVTGFVHRRFFRAGGSTQSRTEVQATTVVETRRATAARRTVEAAARDLAEQWPGVLSPTG